MHKTLFLALLLLPSAPALADVTGRYSDGGKQLVVEVNDDGRARIGPEGGASYSIFDGEEVYFVATESGSPTVTRLSDLVAIAEEQTAAVWRELGMDPPTPAETSEAQQPPAALVPVESRVVNGREGMAYVKDGEEASASRLVLSDDPDLAPLGRAWARLILGTPSFGRLLTGGPDKSTLALVALLERGAPLEMGSARLLDASLDPVSDDRFTLPAEPMSRDLVREAMEKRRQPPAGTPEAKSN